MTMAIAARPPVEGVEIRIGGRTRLKPSGPATHWSYDGLDPNEQRDPHTGRYWSTDMVHCQPLCAAH